MSYPNFVRVSFANIACQIKLLDTRCHAIRTIIQCFDPGFKNTQRGGKMVILRLFLNPGSPRPPNNFMVK